MTLFAGRTTRRRSGGSGPAPTLTSARRSALPASYGALVAGGDAFAATGSNFVAGAVLELINLSTAAVTNVSTTGSGASLAATLPALAEGDYSARVKNPDGQYSPTNLPVAVVRRADGIASVKGSYAQRGDASDYVPTGTTTAPVWTDRSGNGRHIVGQNVAANQAPVTAASLDGVKGLLRGYSDGKQFPAQTFFPGAFFTTTAEAIMQLANLKDTAFACNVTTASSTTYPTVRITDASAGGDYCSFFAGAGSAAGKVTFGFEVYSGGGPKTVAVVDAPAGLSAQLCRHDGVNLSANINGVPSAGSTRACGAKDSAETATYFFQFHAGITQASETYAFVVGQMSEAEMASIYRCWKFYDYPSAGLP